MPSPHAPLIESDLATIFLLVGLSLDLGTCETKRKAQPLQLLPAHGKPTDLGAVLFLRWKLPREKSSHGFKTPKISYMTQSEEAHNEKNFV
jgi:hypothetical protein